MITDTDPQSQELWLRLQRERTPGQQIARALEMTAQVRSMFAANLRFENPSITEDEIKRRMIETYYGAEWAERIYGRSSSDFLRDKARLLKRAEHVSNRDRYGTCC